MGKTIIVAPAIIVMVAAIGRDQSLDEFLQVLNQSRFMLDRGNGRGRARHEDREQTFVDVFFLNLLAKLWRDVDDVAEAGSLFDDFIGANL